MKRIFQSIVWLGLISVCVPTYAVNINFGPNGCTLQDAIRSANTDSAIGNCSSGSGHDYLIAPDGWSITLNSSLPTITSDITIKPTTSSGLLTISGDDSHQVMTITGDSTDVVLNRVYITKGESTSNRGAGLRIIGANVTLLDAVVGFNTTSARYGAGIYIENGTLHIQDSAIEYNTAQNTGNQPSGGGGIYAKNSDVSVLRSKFVKNEAEYRLQNLNGVLKYWDFGFGASLYMEGGNLVVDSSVFSEDHSAIHGEQAVASIENTTVAKLDWPGWEDQRGHVFFTDFSALTLNHVTMNSAFRMEGNSLLSMSNSILTRECNLSATTTWVVDAGNLYNTPNFLCPGKGNLFYNPQLHGLADNGGDTLTFALGLSSDAINAGDPAYCLPTDQRGVVRDAACDIGAFEVADVSDVGVSGQLDAAAPYVHSQDLIYEATIKNNGLATVNEIEIDLDVTNATVTAIDSSLCNSLPCTLTNLQASQEITIPVQLSLPAYDNEEFRLVLTATKTPNSSFTDTNPDNDEHILISQIQDGADMSIQMDFAATTNHYIGEVVEYTVAVSNLGFDTAQGVSFELIDIEGLDIISFSGCTSVNQHTCVLGQMNRNAVKNITVLAEVTESEFDITAMVSSTTLDIYPENDTDFRDNNGALGETDIAVAIADISGSPFYSDSYIQVSVDVTTGSDPASNIRVWPDFPGAAFISCDHYWNFDGYCEIPTLAEKSIETVTFSYFNPVISASYQDNLLFTVNVAPGETDTDLRNNQDSIEIRVKATSDMSAQLSLVTSPPYTSGQEVEFHLKVLNNGINTASGIDIDVVPNNMSLMWMNGTECSSENCFVTAMEVFKQENMVLVYRIDEGGDFGLNATVDATQIDLVPANNLDAINETAEFATRSNSIFKDDFE